MSIRNKRIVLLSSIILLFIAAIWDIVVRKDDMFQSFSNQFVNEQRTVDFRREHQGANVTKQQQIEISRQDDLKELELIADWGNVTIKRATDKSIRLIYSVTATGASQEAAERHRDAVQVTQEKREGRLILVTKSNGKDIDPDRIDMDYELYVPDGLNLIIENNHGKLGVNEIRGNLQVTSTYGLVEIHQVQGNLMSNISYGSLVISDIRGKVTSKSSNSYVHASNIEGGVTLNTHGGNLFADRVTGEVGGKTENGEIHLRGIQGSVTLSSLSSALQLDQVQGNMNITAQDGETRILLLENKGYTLDTTVLDGRIQSMLPISISPVTGNENTSQMKGVIGDGQWQVHVKASSGDVFVHTTK